MIGIEGAQSGRCAGSDRGGGVTYRSGPGGIFRGSRRDVNVELTALLMGPPRVERKAEKSESDGVESESLRNGVLVSLARRAGRERRGIYHVSKGRNVHLRWLEEVFQCVRGLHHLSHELLLVVF